MPRVNLYNTEGEIKGEIEIGDGIFSHPVNKFLMHQALLRQLANRRRGTSSTKTRAEVRGGGKKPWRQKGTGRARHGSIRSPIWKGGGVTFGPKPRDYSQDMPRKMRRAALKSALSMKVAEESFMAVDEIKIAAPKTREFVRIMDNLKIGKKSLFILKDKDEAVVKSASNIEGTRVITISSINIFDLINSKHVVMTKDAIEYLEGVWK